MSVFAKIISQADIVKRISRRKITQSKIEVIFKSLVSTSERENFLRDKITLEEFTQALNSISHLAYPEINQREGIRTLIDSYLSPFANKMSTGKIN